MVSTSSASPIFTPFRRWMQCGAWLLLSCPPATTISAAVRECKSSGRRVSSRRAEATYPSRAYERRPAQSIHTEPAPLFAANRNQRLHRRSLSVTSAANLQQNLVYRLKRGPAQDA